MLMQKYLLIFGLILLVSLRLSAQNTGGMPALIRNKNATQLIVDGKPYLVLGGELGNSSASSTAYMQSIWPKLKQMHLNTLIAPVYWELMEPQEGKFDCTLVDDLLRDARKNNLKLVLLWFGSWKNSMSCYAPEWVKTDEKRFPRIEDHNGKKQEILTPFSKNDVIAGRNFHCIWAASFCRMKYNCPFAISIGSCMIAFTIKFYRNFFVGRRPAPDIYFGIALQNHIIAYQLRQTHLCKSS